MKIFYFSENHDLLVKIDKEIKSKYIKHIDIVFSVLLQKIEEIETRQTYSKFLSNLCNNTHYIFDKVKLTKARAEFISNLALFHHM